MDTWRDVGQVLKLWIRLVKNQILGRNISFFARKNVRERGEEESFQAFFRQSTKFHRSEFIKPRTKVYRLDEGYACIPSNNNNNNNNNNFTEDPKEEIWGKSKFLCLGGVLETSYHSTTLQEIEVLHTLVYFQP